MAEISHQTVRLSRGKHAFPAQGVCVMELASMLAGEDFSDAPECVSPVIGGFLRTYNDGIDDRLRQDLYEFAAKAVDTRSRASVEQRRASDCIAWAASLAGSLTLRFPVFACTTSLRGCEAAGAYAARAALRQGPAAHAEALEFVERLMGLCEADKRPAPAAERPVAAVAS
ncbi:MAG TPA: hypothetical protein VF752_14200 [Thermoleophilaceae bacterium]